MLFSCKNSRLESSWQNNSTRQGYFLVLRSADEAQVMVILSDAELDGEEASVMHMWTDGS